MLIIKIGVGKIVHLGSADFPLRTRCCNECAHTTRVRVSHTRGTPHVERAKSVRQVHPTFAVRAVAPTYLLTCGFCVGYQRHASCKSDSPWKARLLEALSGGSDSRLAAIQNLAAIETNPSEKSRRAQHCRKWLYYACVRRAGHKRETICMTSKRARHADRSRRWQYCSEIASLINKLRVIADLLADRSSSDKPLLMLKPTIRKSEADKIAASEISRFIIVTKSLESDENTPSTHTVVCKVRDEFAKHIFLSNFVSISLYFVEKIYKVSKLIKN